MHTIAKWYTNEGLRIAATEHWHYKVGIANNSKKKKETNYVENIETKVNIEW